MPEDAGAVGQRAVPVTGYPAIRHGFADLPSWWTAGRPRRYS
jgi:hypothetical protein